MSNIYLFTLLLYCDHREERVTVIELYGNVTAAGTSHDCQRYQRLTTAQASLLDAT